MALHFFARTKETKQRRVVEDTVRKKIAVCTFLPTPVLFCAKQKELANAQTSSRSSREGSSFLCPYKETKQRNSPSALFCLLRYFSPLNKKNSLTLKQLFVFNAPKSTSASQQKSEAGPLCFLRNIASLVVCGCLLVILLFPICFARLLPAFSGEA